MSYPLKMLLGRARVGVVAIVSVLAVGVGCNVLTGTSDLDKIDQEPGDDTGAADAFVDAPRDSTADTKKADVSDGAEVAADAPADTAETSDADADADATDAGDAKSDADTKTDGPDTGKVCTLDGECDDTNGCTADKCEKSGTALFGTCSNTKVDADGDGESPSTLGICGTDCHDGDPKVFSKQTAYFTTACLPGGLAGPFDYNCSGVAELQYPSLYKCTRVGTTCTIATGWSTSIPACGGSGTFVNSCTYNSFTGLCNIGSTTAGKLQGCH